MPISTNPLAVVAAEDAINSTVGVVTGKIPQAKYVLFKVLGDDTTRQMAMINN